MDTRAYDRGVSVLAAVWGVLFTVAAILTEPLWRSAGLNRFWLILILSVTWTVPAILWTFVAVAARGGGDFRRMASLAVNSVQLLPMIVVFSAAAPFAVAALLATVLNTIYVLASVRKHGERRPLAFAAAAGLEAAALLRLLGDPLLGAVAGAFGIAAFLWLMPMPNARTSLWKSTASILLTVVIASWFAFTARMALVAAAAVQASEEAANRARPKGGVKRAQAPAADGTEGIGAGEFAGVILWPEEEEITKLVAPLPEWTRASQGLLQTPNSFPFSGEYWLFEPPHHRPPPQSVMRRGKPTKVGFHTVDDQPLFMEAHQKLPMPVAVACCRAIQMEVQNFDPRPGYIVLEMFLVQGEKRMSLGQQAVTARVLQWNMPKGAPLQRFDEIAIIFHREPMPLGFSAKLAIEKFVLVP
jgi:hypothetical protein